MSDQQTQAKPARPVTKVGNVGRDPELRFTPSGKPVCNFSIGVAIPGLKADGRPDWSNTSTEWYEVAVWDQMAENVAESLTRGCRVIVQGRGEVEHYQHEGQDKTRKKITAEAIGPDLRWATCQVIKPERSQPNVTRTVPDATYDEEPF